MIAFTVRWPEDASRVVPLPASNVAHFVAAQPFTLHIGSESWQSQVLDGDSRLELKLADVDSVQDTEARWQFADGSTGRTALALLPDAARLKAGALTHGPWSGTHGILSNLRGNAVQARASWGRVESKYDALLAVNFAEEGPGDRRVVIPWVSACVVLGSQRIELNADTVETFEAREHSLHWIFAVQGLRLEAALWIGDGKAIRLRFKALTPAGKDVQVLVRPALDDRSFHEVTKAFQGAEQRFREALTTEARGFRFALEEGHTLLVHGSADFIAEPAWQYCVPLPEEVQRGLEDMMDVFFAGHFVWLPAEQERFDLTASVDEDEPPVTEGVRREAGRPLPLAMRQSLELYLSARGDALTVIAGYPWFLDWGRDSLIFTRALIADSRLQEAGDVLRRFGSFEDRGTLPNLLRGAEVSNRETSDAPLWWVVAAGEWLAAGGDPALDCDGRSLVDVMLSIVTNYRDGTATGVKMDAASGLIFSPPHFTWMDTNDPCGTPREGYPIEIQALWIAALRTVQNHAQSGAWLDIMDRAVQSVESLYWREADGWFADCLHASTGVPASAAVADDHLRPNQWLAFALNVVRDMDKVRRALTATQCLIVPGAARSLAPRAVQVPLPVIRRDGKQLNDPLYPYWPRYTGPENLSRKPAYHNGTAWCWQFPLYAEAMTYAYGDACHDQARRLMSASVVPWQNGCVGQLPEILDGDLPHLQRGCGAQAWSVSEWVRVWSLLTR